MSISKLPFEVLERIFELLIETKGARFRDYFNCALTCYTWCLVLRSPRLVKHAQNRLAEPCFYAISENSTLHYFRLANGAIHKQLLVADRMGTYSITSYDNGKPHGPFSRYHSNGTCAETAQYSAGVMTGERKLYDRGGLLTGLRHYDEEGRLHGLQEDYDVILHGKATVCVESYTAEHGKKEGAYHSLYNLGVGPREVAHYHCGKLHGERILYCGSATLHRVISRGNYVEGWRDGLVQRYYLSGSLRKQTFYCRGKLEGEYLKWHANGYLAIHKYYRGGQQCGEERTWRDCGVLNSAKQYQAGKVHGECTEYWANEQLSVRCSYKEGKYHGPMQHWDYRGVLTHQSYYENGALEGECLDYDNGRIRECAHYRGGRLHGLYECWDADGRLISHCYYYEGALERSAFTNVDLREK